MPLHYARITIVGFRSLKRVVLPLGRLTLMIGPNGSGKSNLISALRLFQAVRAGELQRQVEEAGGAAALAHNGPKSTELLALNAWGVKDGHEFGYTVHLGHADGDRLHVVNEILGSCEEGDPDGPWTARIPNRAAEESSLDAAAVVGSRWQPLFEWLSPIACFHLQDLSPRSGIRGPALAADGLALRGDGANLAACLLRLSEGEAEQAAWRRITALVHRVAPSVVELCPTRSGAGGELVRLDWIDDQGERFGADQLSDGTLRALALITVLAQPTAQLPKLICIDEPELSLHPAALALLVELARSVSRHCQVLFATQSAAFLDVFSPEEVVVVEREGGATVLRRLEVGELDAWLEVFDKGVIGGRP